MSAQQDLQPTSDNISWIDRIIFGINLTRRISADIDVGLKVRENILVSGFSLDVDRLEKLFEGFFKTCLCARSAVGDATSPETKFKKSM